MSTYVVKRHEERYPGTGPRWYTVAKVATVSEAERVAAGLGRVEYRIIERAS